MLPEDISNLPAKEQSLNTLNNQCNMVTEKKNDKSPECKLHKVLEDRDLKDREFKIAVMKKLNNREDSERQFNEIRNKLNRKY